MFLPLTLLSPITLPFSITLLLKPVSFLLENCTALLFSLIILTTFPLNLANYIQHLYTDPCSNIFHFFWCTFESPRIYTANLPLRVYIYTTNLKIYKLTHNIMQSLQDKKAGPTSNTSTTFTCSLTLKICNPVYGSNQNDPSSYIKKSIDSNQDDASI